MATACAPIAPEENSSGSVSLPDTIVYTAYSKLSNQNINFNSPAAINRLAHIENEHFRLYDAGISRYYGTVWRESAELDSSTSAHGSLFSDYLKAIGGKADSMHCTIYAVEGLKAGMGEGWNALEKSHRRIWKEREHAGWSIGYLLVREWNWKAYLVMDSSSKEFTQCMAAFQNNQSYPVWKQPDIPLSGLLIRGKDNALIQDLLDKNEFGWGFSHQGIHTWITRFDTLKECNWAAAPGKQYDLYEVSLFEKTSFLKFSDYESHVLVFPPKKVTEVED